MLKLLISHIEPAATDCEHRSSPSLERNLLGHNSLICQLQLTDDGVSKFGMTWEHTMQQMVARQVEAGQGSQYSLTRESERGPLKKLQSPFCRCFRSRMYVHIHPQPQTVASALIKCLCRRLCNDGHGWPCGHDRQLGFSLPSSFTRLQ